MEAGNVGKPNIKEELIVPDGSPTLDCSCVKEEPDESRAFDDDDNESTTDSSHSGRLEGLGASLAVIKMEMDLPDSSVSQEILRTEEPHSNLYCPACGILCNSEEEVANHCETMHSDTFIEIRRKDGEPLDRTAFVDRTDAVQANPGRSSTGAMCLYSCNACRYTSLSKQSVLKHMNSHIEVRTLSCEFCLPLFDDEGIKSLGVIPYSCGHCLFRTEDLEEMRNHSMVHHKTVTFLSDLESEDCELTSQSQQIFRESLGIRNEETEQGQDDEDGRKYNLNKENFCSQQIPGDTVNGVATGRSMASHGLIAKDIRTASQAVIPRLTSVAKQSANVWKAPPVNSQVILVDQLREDSDVNSVGSQDKVVNDNYAVPLHKSDRVLRPKVVKHLADPDPNYYMLPTEQPNFSYTVHPLNTESAPPVLPITVAVTSTTDGSRNSSPKKNRKHQKKLCPYCGREARDNYCLKVHMLTHSNEKPFACPYKYCSYRATQKAHVMKHLQSLRHMSTHVGQTVASDSS